MTPKRAHTELDKLRARAVDERVKARDVEARLEAAEQAIENARDLVVEALASDVGDVDTARHTGEQATVEAALLVERNAAAKLRVVRAQAEADGYMREHAPQLLAERMVDVERVTEHLNAAVGDTLSLHHALLSERQELDRVIGAAGGEPRSDGPPPTHEWEKALGELARVVAQHPRLAPPAPRWLGKAVREERDRVHGALQAGRA